MKTDPKLGAEVQAYLIEQGVETPIKSGRYNNQEKKEVIENNFKAIMQALELDLTDDSLKDTPKRVAEMYVNEIFSGLDYNNFPKATAVENKMKCEEMIVVDEISLQSNCDHHFVIIDGFCKIGSSSQY